MFKYVNAALYNVDLEGENTSEFDGEHPTLVIRTKMEKEMYIAIPFTTYTKEKWQKLKKYMCCRSISTNSIARIDKMEIISSGKIKNRWRENGKLLIPEPEDLQNVINNALAYFKSSFSLGKNEYKKVQKNTEQLTKEFEKIFGIHSNEQSFISVFFTQNECIFSFDKSYTNNISIQELYDIINIYFNRHNYKVFMDDKNISIIVANTEKRLLTLKSKYVKVNATEG
ncbi:MAG: hypothetical protein HDR03_04615 [Lachnospiraceae bacterium]|nr:hypothetical protein [Lachnospiraceae bacterium]